jgi:hypothetical protein
MTQINVTHDQANLILFALLRLQEQGEFPTQQPRIKKAITVVLEAQNKNFASKVRGTRDHRLPID